ncbi:MAG: hypothetical protein ABI206_10295 [Antricoccus sp.]
MLGRSAAYTSFGTNGGGIPGSKFEGGGGGLLSGVLDEGVACVDEDLACGVEDFADVDVELLQPLMVRVNTAKAAAALVVRVVLLRRRPVWLVRYIETLIYTIS